MDKDLGDGGPRFWSVFRRKASFFYVVFDDSQDRTDYQTTYEESGMEETWLRFIRGALYH